MDEISEKAIRDAFVNCSKGEARRITLPPDLAAMPWTDLDFLGWRDPRTPDRAYLVVPWNDRLIGITMRAPTGGRGTSSRSGMCMVCLTTHASSDVGLFVAAKAGSSGRRGNTVGLYICADLGCSLYLRGKRKASAVQACETLTMEERLARSRANFAGFITHLFDDELVSNLPTR